MGAAVTGSFFLHPATARAAAMATRVRFKAVVPPGFQGGRRPEHAAQSSPMAAGFKDGRTRERPGKTAAPSRDPG